MSIIIYLILACLKTGYALSSYHAPLLRRKGLRWFIHSHIINNSVVCVVFNQDAKVHQWLRHKMMFFCF